MKPTTKQNNSPKPSSNDNKQVQQQKTTSQDEQKVIVQIICQRYRLLKRLTSLSADMFRQMDINEYDINITEHFEELEYIDDTVTPLIYCAHYGSFLLTSVQGLKQIIRFLLKNRDIDVDLETENNKQTPLIVACINGNYEIVRVLLLAGAQVNKPNSLNQNALTAILFRLVEETYSFQNKKICFLIGDLLVKHGADINWIVDKTKGYSLLHYFCATKMKMNKTQKLINYEIVKFLLKHGANIQQKTLKDETCFSLVQKHCNKEEIQELLKVCREQQQIKKNKDNEQPAMSSKRKKIAEDFFKIDVVNVSKAAVNNDQTN